MTMHSKGVDIAKTFPGLLAGLMPGQSQSWGLLDVVALQSAQPENGRARFVSPLEHLKLVRVPSYGTLVLQNLSHEGPVIVPMHVGFFQVGAQNHATSRVVILGPGKTLEVKDCFCIQQSQGGLLKEAQQRFIILPLDLRKAALSKRGESSFSRLWSEIDTYNRRYGIARGGHLERFLRPYFHRLLPFRHALEIVPGQVGAAYFIAGKLAGLEVAPNPAYWQDVGPILNIYCYGSAALLGERRKLQAERQSVDLTNLADIDDLAQRLATARQKEQAARAQLVAQVSDQPWDFTVEAETQGLRIVHLAHGEWVGQMVKDGEHIVYLSAFRNVTV